MRTKVLITGKNSSLSASIAERFVKDSTYKVDRLSLWGDDWKQYVFSDIQIIVHVVGMTPDRAKSAEDYYAINTDLTKELALLAKKNGVSHFIYLSSMAVYGVEQSFDLSVGAVTAETICSPRSDYGKSKWMAEKVLYELENDSFHVTTIRVPSIYGAGKTEYIDQYQYLANKLPFIPIAFSKHYKSAISVTNLCELVYMIAANTYYGIVCPDDGHYSAVDFCMALQPDKKQSRFVGMLMELILKKNARMLDYYGAVYYSAELSSVFNCEYRKVQLKDALCELYRK